MKNKNTVFRLLTFTVLAFFFHECANPVSPTGGPKDEQPPRAVSSSPPNNSLFFKSKKITITFNEFVKLKNPNQQVLISPPLPEKPEYKLKGKSLIIEIENDLLPNTTYTIFFGNAIVDLTEENPLANYLYAFSTGDHIDSLAIGGEVKNAFNLQPMEEVFVMLYPISVDTVPDDSIPMLVRPLYVAKADKNGQFQLRNLRNEQFRLFALKDANSNYLFDQPNEDIAFLDTLIRPELPDFHDLDIPGFNDSLVATADTTHIDSLTLQNVYGAYQHLFMFLQVDSTQRLLGEEVFYPPKFRLNYKFPAKDPRFTVVNKELEEGWDIKQINKGRDSLTVWVRDLNLDSLQIAVADADTVLDTVLIIFSKEKVKNDRKRGGKNKDKETVERINIKTNSRGTSLDLGKPFRLMMENPLTSYDFSNVFFIAGKDSMNGAPFKVMDSINSIFELDYDLQDGTKYEFVFPDSIFYSIYGLTNDSLQANFTTGKMADYGNLILDLAFDSNEFPYILQLLDQKERVLKEVYVENSQTVKFEFLKAGKYLVKAIQDKWRNKRWDTGVYVEKRQPENVFYFPAEIQIRANWDVQENWQLP